MRGYFKLGSLRWSPDGWLLCVLQLRHRAYGWFWSRAHGQLVLILGCEIVERSAFGAPEAFAGGSRLSLSARAPFPRRMPPVIARRDLVRGRRAAVASIAALQQGST